MPVFFDQQPVTVPHDSLAGAIEAARQVAEARGRVVVDVLLDGERLDEDALQQPSAEPLGGREIRFTSVEPRVFVGQALLDAVEELESITKNQQAAAKGLRSGNLPAAFEALQSAVDSWQLVRRAAGDGPALLGLDPGRVSVRGEDGRAESLATHVEALAHDLRTLQNALSIQDWSSISDLLGAGGELDERATQWRILLTDLAYQIDPRPR